MTMNTLCDLLVSIAEVFAVMMAYNLIRPVKMAHAKPVTKPCCSSCKE